MNSHPNKDLQDIYVFLTEDKSGEIVSTYFNESYKVNIPLIAVSEELLPAMIERAKEISATKCQKIKLVKFTKKEFIKYID